MRWLGDAAAIIVCGMISAAAVGIVSGITAAGIGIPAAMAATAARIRLDTAGAGTVAVDRSHRIQVDGLFAAAIVFVRWKEFINREFKGIKQLAGIFVFAA